MNIVFVLLALIIVGFVMMIILGMIISAPRYHGSPSDHFDGKAFRNPEGVKAKGGLGVFKWMLSRKRGPWKESVSIEYGKRPLTHFKDGIRVTFVNHSTFLIQVDGVNILTDPVWSKRVSPYSWIGPKRMRPPGIRFEDLPRIHLVLLSHNHYDHLDLQTMRMVFGGHHPRIITPLGVKKFLDDHYITGAVETDWWQEVEVVNRLKVQSVPAQHFSGRGLMDRDGTLWCGYVIRSSAGNVYFAGDTGYNPVTFRDIGARCGPMKISMLPIGAYKPAWFMAPIHVSPEESVRIHIDTQSQTSIATHFGTFPLADDGSDDPVNDLKIALEKFQITSEGFLVLKEGEARIFD
jgi:L-ascorbate metabolism protein UlaG (beta-lactamase superfamily)